MKRPSPHEAETCTKVCSEKEFLGEGKHSKKMKEQQQQGKRNSETEQGASHLLRWTFRGTETLDLSCQLKRLGITLTNKYLPV